MPSDSDSNRILFKLVYPDLLSFNPYWTQAVFNDIKVMKERDPDGEYAYFVREQQ